MASFVDEKQRVIDDLHDLADPSEIDMSVVQKHAHFGKVSSAIRHYLVHSRTVRPEEWTVFSEANFNLTQTAIFIRVWETLSLEVFPETANLGRPAKGTLGRLVDDDDCDPEMVCSNLVILDEKLKSLPDVDSIGASTTDCSSTPVGVSTTWDWFIEDLPHFFSTHPRCARVYHQNSMRNMDAGQPDPVLVLVSRNRTISVLQEGENLTDFFNGFCNVITALRTGLGKTSSKLFASNIFPWRVVPLKAQLFEGGFFPDVFLDNPLETRFVQIRLISGVRNIELRVGSADFSKGQVCALSTLCRAGCFDLEE